MARLSALAVLPLLSGCVVVNRYSLIDGSRFATPHAGITRTLVLLVVSSLALGGTVVWLCLRAWHQSPERQLVLPAKARTWLGLALCLLCGLAGTLFAAMPTHSTLDCTSEESAQASLNTMRTVCQSEEERLEFVYAYMRLAMWQSFTGQLGPAPSGEIHQALKMYHGMTAAELIAAAEALPPMGEPFPTASE